MLSRSIAPVCVFTGGTPSRSPSHNLPPPAPALSDRPSSAYVHFARQHRPIVFCEDPFDDSFLFFKESRLSIEERGASECGVVNGRRVEKTEKLNDKKNWRTRCRNAQKQRGAPKRISATRSNRNSRGNRAVMLAATDGGGNRERHPAQRIQLSDYIAKITIPNFEKQSGVKVKYETTQRRPRPASNCSPQFGLRHCGPDQQLRRQADRGKHLLPLDKSNYPTSNTFDPT